MIASSKFQSLGAHEGRVITTLSLSPHSLTNIDTIGKFLPVKIQVHDDGGQRCTVEVGN